MGFPGIAIEATSKFAMGGGVSPERLVSPQPGSISRDKQDTVVVKEGARDELVVVVQQAVVPVFEDVWPVKLGAT